MSKLCWPSSSRSCSPRLAQPAEHLTAGLADPADDPDVREQFAELLREKRRHVRMTERLIEIVD